HQAAVVLHHGALAGGEVVALGPAEADADAEHADLGVGVDAAGVAGDVEAGDADAARRAGDFHHAVEHRGGLRGVGVTAVAAGLEADAVHRAVDLRHAEDLLDLLGQVAVLGEADRLAAERLRLVEPLLDHVADDHDRGAEDLAAVGA